MHWNAPSLHSNANLPRSSSVSFYLCLEINKHEESPTLPTINERKISPGQLELQRRIAQAQLLRAPTQDHSNDASEGRREVNMAKRFEKTPAPRVRASSETKKMIFISFRLLLIIQNS